MRSDASASPAPESAARQGPRKTLAGAAAADHWTDEVQGLPEPSSAAAGQEPIVHCEGEQQGLGRMAAERHARAQRGTHRAT